MIDLSSLKTPGWARIVAELHAPAPDDRTFIHKLVAVLAQVSGARQGVLFAVEAGESDASGPEPRPLFIWPTAGSGEPSTDCISKEKSVHGETWRLRPEPGHLQCFLRQHLRHQRSRLFSLSLQMPWILSCSTATSAPA